MAARRTAPRKKTSVLASLTLGEKGELLDQLLTARPELKDHAEELARLRLAEEDRDAVAADVEWAMKAHDIDELNGRAGYHPGRGYVDPGEAAAEILDDALQPFLDDLARRANRGLASAAAEVTIGVLCGLYACRDACSETLLEYSPDYAIERASDLIHECAKLDVALPVSNLLNLVPTWGRLFHAATARGPA